MDMVWIFFFVLCLFIFFRRRRGLGYCIIIGDLVISCFRWIWFLNLFVIFNKFFIYCGLVYGWFFIVDGIFVFVRFYVFGIRYIGLDWCWEGEIFGIIGEFWFFIFIFLVEFIVFGYVVGVGNDIRYYVFVCNESIGN